MVMISNEADKHLTKISHNSLVMHYVPFSKSVMMSRNTLKPQKSVPFYGLRSRVFVKDLTELKNGFFFSDN